jgi:pyruvate,water dikinase
MMLAGVEALSMMRPQAELAKLAKLAVVLNLNDLFKANLRADELISKLGETRAGRRWLEVLETAKDPWFYCCVGTGFQTRDRCWLDDLNVPFGFIGSYIEKWEKGEEVERDTLTVGAAREKLVEEYYGLLRTDEDKETFSRLHNLMMKVYPYAETHIFYVEHWFHSIHRNKVREVSKMLVNAKFFDDIEDIFYFYPNEIEEMLEELVDVWGAGEDVPSRGGSGYFKKELQWRKDIIEKLREYSPPPALGPAPDAVTEPLVIHLWGITTQTVQTWLDAMYGGAALSESELKGFAASPGIVEGTARVLKDASQLSQVKEGEILVAPLTSPSWAPVFHKLKGIVTDLGGISSHAAIVAREYGLPCVVGVGFGTKFIKTGDIVRLDGSTGDVTVVKKG